MTRHRPTPASTSGCCTWSTPGPGGPCPTWPCSTPWSLARWLDVGASRYHLTALPAAYGLRVTQHHNAAADAHDTAELLRKLLSAAADQQVCAFNAEHPTKRKEPVLRRTGD